MKSSLNPEAPKRKKDEEVNPRTKAARGRDISGNRRSIAGIAVIGSLVACCIGSGLVAMKRAEYAIGDLFTNEAPGPSKAAVLPLSPELQSASNSPKPPMPKILLGAAQKEIGAAMKNANVPVLGTNRSGFNNPPTSEAFGEFLDERARAYSKRAKVATSLGAATTHCSTLVTQSRGNDIPKPTVKQITDSFAQGDMEGAATACKQGAQEAWREGIIYFNMPAAGE